MTFTVYAMRLKGDNEARYVGQTGNTLESRLVGHRNNSQAMPWPTLFAKWILEHAAEVEVVAIDTAETREDALTKESVAIKSFLAMGHRLFNRHGVPRDKRTPVRDESDRPAYLRAAA